ncbi:hypothetical protein F5X68DRAFT_276570 [Plectosphaerella plurivora]|uniref:SnoaL-like domain-containing protein n=1 Tax=Plectosphaerella plurivora TaxID=936078 RepID=A0A9P8VA01_9PEZI|nr:hypothetical protein F5X68DRAFT_276570 [Plectosphaerella plurivora]
MSASTLDATVKAFCDALAAVDMDRAGSFLAPDYDHTFLPASAGLGPNLGRDKFLGHFGSLRPIVDKFDVTILETWPNEAGRTVTLRATNAPHFKDSIKRPEDADDEWTFLGEYLFVFTMDESGEKIVKALEFVDSAAALKMKTLVPKAVKRLASSP